MVDALITPKMVAWARKRVNWTSEKLADEMSVTQDKIHAWEREEQPEHPTFRQAINLSSKLHIPFGYLYLTKPPIENVSLPDLRTIANKPLQNPSIDFIDTLYDAYRKQDWFRDFLSAVFFSNALFTEFIISNTTAKA